MDLRLIGPTYAAAAADLHRRAGALIPGYDTSHHTEEAFRAFYSDRVMRQGPVWGVFDGDRLIGCMALLPGWIDHLYVDPAFHGRGVGGRLVQHAQAGQAELRLYTFQSNVRARRFYERHGFEIEETTDGARNEERMPDLTYRWTRP